MVRIRRKSMVQNKEIGKEPKIKYLYQGQSEILKHWLNLDIEWVEETLGTREPQFYEEAISNQY